MSILTLTSQFYKYFDKNTDKMLISMNIIEKIIWYKINERLISKPKYKNQHYTVLFKQVKMKVCGYIYLFIYCDWIYRICIYIYISIAYF